MHKRAISAAIATLFAASATAQTKVTEQIVVTGSRVAESASELPASISVVGSETIADHLRVTPEMQNLLAIHVPGMAPSTGTSSNSGQTLRGRMALVMIDGVPQSTPLRNGQLGIRTLDASVIERVEVIKGATSIYGNGAAGGVIHYITRQPLEREFGGDVSLSTRFSAVKFDDSQGARLSAVADGSRDALSYVVSGTYEESGLERDAEGDILGLVYGLSETTTQNYFTKLAAELTPEQRLQLTYNYYESQQDSDLIDITGSVNSGEKTYATENPEGAPRIGAPQGPRGNHNLMGKYSHDAIFANTQLVADAYYQEIENVFFFSSSLANPEQGLNGGQSMIKSVKQGARLGLDSALKLGQVEATFIYGADLLNDVTSQPLLDGRMWVPEMDLSSLAGYMQTKFVVAEDWILKAGVRKDFIDVSVDDYQTLRLCRNADTCSVPIDVQGGEIDYRSTTYNLGVRYKAEPAFSPFINYSQGSDISDLGRLLRTATVTDIALIQTEASLVDHYEVGFTSTLPRAVFEFAAYRSESELGTYSEYDPATGVYLPVRAPQKIQGFEAALDFVVTDRLDAGITYSSVEGKNTANDVYLGGSQISPPKLTAHLDWQPTAVSGLALTYLRVGSRNRFATIEGEYQGDQGPVKNYDVLNLSGYYQIEDWRVFAGIENLLNEDYYSARAQVLTYPGYNTKGLGTTVNIGVNYSF